MKIIRLFTVIIVGLLLPGTQLLNAQGGDQMLDGIGETALIARYPFKGNANDWSRNNLHASVEGTNYTFASDERFGTVLSFPGESDTFVSIPGRAISGEESLTISGWIYLHSDKSGQTFFDFGKDGSSRLYVAPEGTADEEGCIVRLVTSKGSYTVAGPSLALSNWIHLALVVDTPSKSLTLYINGVVYRESENVEANLKELFDGAGEDNRLIIGKSLSAAGPGLNAKLSDFRIYRIPLAIGQIARISRTGLAGENTQVRTRREVDPDLPGFPEDTRQLYNAFLVSVPDISVETSAGSLPALPRFVKGIYSNGFEGPEVRVLWPAPTDNTQVLSPGTYEVTGTVSGTAIRPRAWVTVSEAAREETPGRVLEPFDLDRVSLNVDIHDHNTKFIENRDKFIAGLAATNPDNFLYMFRNAFGQEQPDGAEALRGWDSQQTKLRGHATGHYLSAIAQAYASTGYDQSLQSGFAAKMEYMVNSLYDLSKLSGQPREPGGGHVADPTAVTPGPGKADFDSDLSVEGIRTDYQNWGKGFISAYPPDQFIMLENGATYGGDNAKIWAPYYTLHKILAGLMDIYEVSGNPKALEIVTGMGDWVYARLSQLPVNTLISMWNRYIAGEYGGMNEAMARLSRLSGEPKYLQVAQLFDNIRVFFGDAEHSHGLARNVDMFRGLHANQHIPQIIGALETYRDLEEPDYYHIANNFWKMATNDYMYSIGGVAGARNPSNAECFTGEPATLYENGFSAGGQNETCATYNMLKLTGNLFLFDPRGELMDYYERALYNHILASVDDETPANTYHVPLRAGSVKQFGNSSMNGFSCCNGTALESNTKLQGAIYFRSMDNEDLYVNLFVPSTLSWTERDISVTQSTAFPKEESTRLTIKGSGRFDLHVRVPHWATKGFFVTLNGKRIKTDAVPGTYLAISRKWKNGDTLELKMPFTFYLEPVMDQQNVASLFWGPVLLAAQETEPLKEWRKVTLDAGDISKSISGDPSQLEFTVDGVVFRPFYETYGRYSVYVDVTLK